MTRPGPRLDPDSRAATHEVGEVSSQTTPTSPPAKKEPFVHESVRHLDGDSKAMLALAGEVGKPWPPE